MRKPRPIRRSEGFGRARCKNLARRVHCATQQACYITSAKRECGRRTRQKSRGCRQWTISPQPQGREQWVRPSPAPRPN
jgi:hypothetical protein